MSPPSIRLGEQTGEELRRRGVRVRLINSQTNPGHVKGEIIRALKQAPDTGLVLIINWQTYDDRPNVPKEENFQLIIELIGPEAFSPSRSWLPTNSFIDTDVYSVSPPHKSFTPPSDF